MGAYNNKEKIIAHYDFVSPFYYALWGEHLHEYSNHAGRGMLGLIMVK